MLVGLVGLWHAEDERNSMLGAVLHVGYAMVSRLSCRPWRLLMWAVGDLLNAWVLQEQVRSGSWR